MKAKKEAVEESNMPAYKSNRLVRLELAGWNDGGFTLTKNDKDKDGNWDPIKVSFNTAQIIVLHHMLGQA